MGNKKLFLQTFLLITTMNFAVYGANEENRRVKQPFRPHIKQDIQKFFNIFDMKSLRETLEGPYKLAIYDPNKPINYKLPQMIFAITYTGNSSRKARFLAPSLSGLTKPTFMFLTTVPMPSEKADQKKSKIILTKDNITIVFSKKPEKDKLALTIVIEDIPLSKYFVYSTHPFPHLYLPKDWEKIKKLIPETKAKELMEELKVTISKILGPLILEYALKEHVCGGDEVVANIVGQYFVGPEVAEKKKDVEKKRDEDDEEEE